MHRKSWCFFLSRRRCFVFDLARKRTMEACREAVLPNRPRIDRWCQRRQSTMIVEARKCAGRLETAIVAQQVNYSAATLSLIGIVQAND
jgi:hypothetical protein